MWINLGTLMYFVSYAEQIQCYLYDNDNNKSFKQVNSIVKEASQTQ